MPATRVSEQKRKQTAEVAEPLASSGGQSKSKARRVSTDAQEATHAVASHQTAEKALTATTATSTTVAPPEDSMESIGQLIQDLSFRRCQSPRFSRRLESGSQRG
jgi:hypothetical protein